MINQICIIGVGLMGGSFGLSVRRSNPNISIIGVDSPDVCDVALERGAITRAASSIQEGIADADLIMLCTPVGVSSELLKLIGKSARDGAIVSDVCSVKLPLQNAAETELPGNVTFIGGHPMTGSENSGIQHAEEFLYENATYVLCPPASFSATDFTEEFESFIELIRSTGGRILLMDADKHDRIAAQISHLPQLLAIALVNYVGARQEMDPELLQLAAGGFRDMTRIASSSFDMWREIIQSNSPEIQRALQELAGEIEGLREMLVSGDIESIGERFKQAEATRTSIPARSKGFLRPLADVFVFVSDQPGAIYDMTGRLSKKGISIKDIELLKIREGTGGTFRLGLQSDEMADRAMAVLAEAGYRVHRL